MSIKTADGDILLVTDIQHDFLPGGALAVREGDTVIAPINHLLETAFRHAVATQDWHPKNHFSFASRHPGKKPFDVVGEQTLWPDHCVQGTVGAELHPKLAMNRIELVLRKGFRREIDSYSAFLENDKRTPTGLASYLRERGFRRVFIAGLARGYCTDYSAEDSARAGFETYLIEDAIRGITQEATDAGTARLVACGVKFLRSADFDSQR